MNDTIARALRSVFGSPTRNAAAATPASTRSTTTMTTFRGGAYNTGISEQAAEDKAAEDGQAGSLDPANVGENSHPHAADHLVDGHDAATSVIGHDLREEVQRNDEDLDSLSEKVKHTEATALEAIDEHTSAMRQWLIQGQRMRASALSTPARHGSLHLALLLLLLFAGDWGLLALGFQIMGLSDRPWIPGISFTDDLHLAALSAVMALVYLGHIVGNHVRRIEHDLEVRRQAGDKRDDYPKPAPFDYAWSITALIAAIAGVAALSSIRAEYLRQIGVDANYWAFIGVQLVILAAAIGIGFAHANPEADRCKGVGDSLESATIKRETAVVGHTSAVGDYNSLIDRRCALMAMAGHHINADAANVRGQIAAFKRRYILAQLEPAQDQLFKQHLETATHHDGELLARLTGVTPFPAFSKAATQKVMNALAAALSEISALRARIDQIEINKLDLPAVNELFIPIDANQPEDEMSEDTAPSTDESGSAYADGYGNTGAPTTLHPMRASGKTIASDIAEESA